MNRKLLFGVLLSTAVIGGCEADDKKAQQAAAPEAKAQSVAKQEVVAMPAELSTEEQQVSYGIGQTFADNLKKQGIELKMDAFVLGVTDSIKGNTPKMDQAQIMKVMQAFQQKIMAKRQSERTASGDKNKQEATAFLADNVKKEGVETTESGLQYKIVTAGSGPKPAATDTVEVNYRGTLLDGTEFDSSYKRGQSVSFPVKGVIAGWTEALQLMPVGSKWELYIPPNLAYGPGGTGPIGPNSALIFEVELLSIKAAQAAAKPEKKAASEG